MSTKSPRSVRRPILFSALVTLGFLVLLVVVAVLGSLDGRASVQEAVGTLGRGLMATGALVWLSHLGWRSWLGGAGSKRAWPLAALPLLYILATYPLLFTGSYRIAVPDPALAALVATNGFTAGVMEELVFRGLVLGALLMAWGRDRRGVWLAILVSSLFFSAPHALNVLAGAELLRTGAQLVWAVLLGIVFGALVVAGGSLWPVALLHGVGNAVIHVQRLGAEVSTTGWRAVLLALAPVPLLAYAWLALHRRRDLSRGPERHRPETPTGAAATGAGESRVG